MAKGKGPSVLVVQEALAAGDAPRFLDLFDQLADGKDAIQIVNRWKTDFRPWAREQLIAYLEADPPRPYYRLVAKRFFKHAEEKGDDALVGWFMAHFDRLVRREIKTRYRYDWRSRKGWSEEVLVARRRRPGQAPFSYHTRYYLRRRAWRYFRRTGFQKPDQYVPAVAGALVHYRNADLDDGLAIMDSWSLVHACFGESDAIRFNTSHALLTRPARLPEMVAPMFPDLWRRPAAANVLLDLLWSANSRVVRLWAAQLLRRDHRESLANAPIVNLLKLIDHEDPQIQQLGAELLENARGLDQVDIATWLRLLQTPNVTAGALLAELMRKHVRPERLTLADAVDLARAKPVPVARLGLDFLRARSIDGAADREQVARLSSAECEGVGRDIALFALGVVGAAGHYQIDAVSRFFDSLLASVRQGAWEWLTETSAGWNDSALWSRLLETPYEDARRKLIATLERRAKLPGVGVAGLSTIWTGVLLAVHRGGRAKLTALRQISDALTASPEHAEILLPALAVAIRSVRLPETRAGLAAVVTAVEARPELEPLVSRYLPELSLQGAGA
jgi:hypothetical protein